MRWLEASSVSQIVPTYETIDDTFRGRGKRSIGPSDSKRPDRAETGTYLYAVGPSESGPGVMSGSDRVRIVRGGMRAIVGVDARVGGTGLEGYIFFSNCSQGTADAPISGMVVGLFSSRSIEAICRGRIGIGLSTSSFWRILVPKGP
jgi:hypothetical protein